MMRSREEIERLLAHLQSTCGKSGTDEDAHWIEALQWVLGRSGLSVQFERRVTEVEDVITITDSGAKVVEVVLNCNHRVSLVYLRRMPAVGDTVLQCAQCLHAWVELHKEA